MLARRMVADGGSLYMFTEGDTITSVPVGGGSPKTMATFRGRTDEAVVSRNGRRLLCNVAETNADIWLVESQSVSQNALTAKSPAAWAAGATATPVDAGPSSLGIKC